MRQVTRLGAEKVKGEEVVIKTTEGSDSVRRTETRFLVLVSQLLVNA